MSDNPNNDDLLSKRTVDEKAVFSVIMEQGHEIDRKLEKLDGKIDALSEKIDRKFESVESSLTILRERTAELKHLATKEELQKLKVWWLCGIIAGMGVAATIAAIITAAALRISS